MTTFIVDFPDCKAKVGAVEESRVEKKEYDEISDEPYGQRIHVGRCPACGTMLVGLAWQLDFAGYDADEDRWQDIIRVYPKPPKYFSSLRIPNVLKQSLEEAERSMQAGANNAACVMLGRALEALCRDVLHDDTKTSGGRSKRPMLGCWNKGVAREKDY